ncbi:MAG: transposase [Candidatus Thiodiazotropha sp.]
MNPIIGCDAHRRYSVFAVFDTSTLSVEQVRVNHQPGAIKEFLSDFPEGTPVALETVGNYYWIVDEIEQAGCVPQLAHAAKAKVIMGNVNKTDKLDAKGLATLVHLGSLPTVWLPPGEIRDERELHRTRMALSKVRTALKNRIHATLAKYALNTSEYADVFVGRGRAWLDRSLKALPPETGRCVDQELALLDSTMAASFPRSIPAAVRPATDACANRQTTISSGLLSKPPMSSSPIDIILPGDRRRCLRFMKESADEKDMPRPSAL